MEPMEAAGARSGATVASTTGVSSRRTASRREWSEQEVLVVEAVRTCIERWGLDKVTVDDVAKQSGISRATLYRLFPGGRDVIFEAHRVYELDRFFVVLLEHIAGAATLEDLVVRAVVCATIELRTDEHLAVMLASEPGTVVSELTVEGLPRIVRVASAYLTPFADDFLPRTHSRALIDVVARLVISYFLSPSDLVDFGDPDSARVFVAPFVQASLVAAERDAAGRDAITDSSISHSPPPDRVTPDAEEHLS